MDNILKHFKTIMEHKYWVGKYCFLAGLYWRGIKHDMSKFHPIEFRESIKYYTGKRSPIDVCKEMNGVSQAWLHHKGRNDHHYLYWQDNFDQNNGRVIPTHSHMPYKPLLESICDSLGAARTYLGEEFSYYKEYKWYCEFVKNSAMNDLDKRIVLFIVFKLAYIETKYGICEPEKVKKVLRRTFNEVYTTGIQNIIGCKTNWNKCYNFYKSYNFYREMHNCINGNLLGGGLMLIDVDIMYYDEILRNTKRRE